MATEDRGAPLPNDLPAASQEVRRNATAATDELNAAMKDFVANPEPFGNDVDKAQRRRIIDAAQKLLTAVKDPADEWMDVTVQMALMAAARLFTVWEVWDEIPLEGSISYADLAAKVDSETSLLSRIGGVLVSVGVLEQIGPDQVAHTSRSRIFTKNQPAGLVWQVAWENALIPYAHMPKYFEEYGRREPQKMNHVPITFAYGHPEWSFYEMLQHDPAWMQRFLKTMGPIEEKMPIAGIYDFGWVVRYAQDNQTPNRPLFVDVGGGRGQAVKAIHKEFPGLPLDRCVLQDRLEVIEAVKSLDDADMREVQKMTVDFHKEQPVKGALTYWIRRCLHNYSDDISINILSIIAKAMAEDSKLLIEEDIMGNPPYYMATMLDILMLGFGGKQRTLECWKEVISKAGLEISSISKGKGPWKNMAVIECVKSSG